MMSSLHASDGEIKSKVLSKEADTKHCVVCVCSYYCITCSLVNKESKETDDARVLHKVRVTLTIKDNHHLTVVPVCGRTLCAHESRVQTV